MASLEKTRHQAERIGPVTGRFATVKPDEFRSTMQGLWESAKAINDTVADEVQQGNITPVQGAAVVASVTGSLLGFPEFQREVSPSHLALSMIGYGNGQ